MELSCRSALLLGIMKSKWINVVFELGILNLVINFAYISFEKLENVDSTRLVFGDVYVLRHLAITFQK